MAIALLWIIRRHRAELEENRQIITFAEASPFNKNPLIAVFTPTGSKVETHSAHTIISNGEKTRIPLTPTEFTNLRMERIFPVVV